MADREADANEAIKAALQALQRAHEMSERAGYGQFVLEALCDAQRSAQYAYDVAKGR
jgi:hypothetical protein